MRRLEKIDRLEISSHSVLRSINMLKLSGDAQHRRRDELARTFENASKNTAEQLTGILSQAGATLAMLRRLDQIQVELNDIICSLYVGLPLPYVRICLAIGEIVA